MKAISKFVLPIVLAFVASVSVTSIATAQMPYFYGTLPPDSGIPHGPTVPPTISPLPPGYIFDHGPVFVPPTIPPLPPANHGPIPVPPWGSYHR